MTVNRYTFKTLPPEWRDCEAWPAADLTTASDSAKARFERLSRGMRLYLRTGALRAASQEAGCSGPVLIDLMNRCVHVTAGGQLVGWLGLVYGTRIGRYSRKKAPTGAATEGTAGSFERFLRDHEEFREKLHEIIRAGGGRRPTQSRAPTLRSVFKTFREHCISEGLTVHDYPFYTKSGGRRSVERYAVCFIAADPRATEVWYGIDASVGRMLGTGRTSFPFAMEPLDVVCMDAHKIHCHGVVVINGPAGPQKVPIERLWFYACLDRKSRCVLGYSVSIRKEISSSNVEEAIVSCTQKWAPRQLRVPGHNYVHGACLPAGNIAGLEECRPCVLLMDNAAQHYANRIAHGVRRALGCAITFGPVGGWWRNAVTERLFRTLEQYGFQRLPSSTGSHPKDPVRSEPVANAVKHCIEWEELLDLVDVVIANYNATPHRGLGSQTPLQVLAMHLQATNAACIPRLSVPTTATTPPLGVTIEVRHIGGCATKGRLKRPYVEVDKVRYTNPELSARFDLLKQLVVVHIDEHDMRKVRAFLEGGEPLGDLVPMDKGWAQTPHTREMRKAINALIDSKEVAHESPDYVLAYMDHLVSRAHKEIKERPAHVSRTATRLADAARVAGVPIPAVRREEVPHPPPLNRPMPGHIKPPPWRSY